ncbi:MAG: hypothetical protein A2Y02_02000 [Omnitrophica bacterium GWA2_52_12]|nr:MAG: hypothetical protein A2Y02_02000 [Omnitrophica bacterium GWA2_52_12]
MNKNNARHKLILAVFLALVFLCPARAHAAFRPSVWTKQKTYGEKIIGKLGFGPLNFFTGWDALFLEPSHEGKFFKGFAQGILYTILYEAGGAIHTVTFPIPVDLPLPQGGVHFEPGLGEGQ